MAYQKDTENQEIKYLRKMADFSGKRVLEIGCGEGRLTWKYAASARQVVGIDTDPDGLRVSVIETPADLRKSTVFGLADSVHLPFPDETFDIALFSWSL